jgi:predicted CXXCH cytochrome family protein
MVIPVLRSGRSTIIRLAHIGIVLIFFLASHTQRAEAARLPSANRECATCHIMWLADFKRTDVETLIPYDPTPLEDFGKVDVVSTRRMCFSCHDGFVLDSRFIWEKGKHAHPVGVKPSEKVEIPLVEGKELFPMNGDGKMYCGTCHTAHGVDWEQNESAVFMRVTNDDGKLCLSCHDNKPVKPEKGGHPVFQKKVNDIPATLIKAGARFDADGKMLCQSCHRPHAAAGKKMLVVENDRSQLCGTCHDDRYAQNRKEASIKGTHPVNVRSDQIRMPETLKKLGARSGKKGEIICQSCHSLHDATPNTPILVKANHDSGLCETCHQEKNGVAGAKHDMGLVDVKDKNVQKKSVAESGVCSACHLAHKGTGPKMWARPLKGKKTMTALCQSCHSNKGIANKSQVGSHSHPVGVDVASLGHKVELPTYSAEGVKYVDTNKGLVTCASCHDPHRWDPRDPEVKAKPGEKSNATNRFLRKVNNTDSKLCRTCHKRQAGITGTKHNLELTAAGKQYIRKQTRNSGICGSCHLVHNAKGPFLWARKLTKGVDVTSAVCLSCHDEQSLANKKTIGEHTHPVKVNLKQLPINIQNGRWNGDSTIKGNRIKLQSLPLYTKQGRRTGKKDGQIGCGTCHDPHKWSPDGRGVRGKNIAKTEGGLDDSFLRIADQGNSALCINCHLDKQPVSRSRHNPALQGSRGSNSGAPKQDKEGGVCMSCHIPHNAKGPLLWARKTGPGKSAIESLCNDCHRKGGTAEKKLVAKHGHPIGKKLTSGMSPRGLPVFSQGGVRTKNKGLIDCATCHDPHRWTSTGFAGVSDADLNKEGDGSNSFLRISAAPSSQLCVECHQAQARVIGTDHDLTITAPSSVNRNGQKVAESGICGQCHIPHSIVDTPLLWARFWDDEGINTAEKRCRTCHSKGEIADRKVPTAAWHPDKVEALSSTMRSALHEHPVPDLPVYNKAGKKAAIGLITCPTCHNPHQWDPASTAEGPGKNIEGDVRTSFLRVSNTESFTCADCHGLDSLYRYKYFHSESTHKKQNK